jgi:hypothetical protein
MRTKLTPNFLIGSDLIKEERAMYVKTESHLIAALVTAGWRLNSLRMWMHEGVSGEYTLLEAVRMLR